MDKDCDDGCEALATQRLQYFTGRHMTARDFAAEQNYHRTHRYLHNRMLHGWGVVCGLHVHRHPSENCRNDHVKVDCGLALDCCGREIPVPKNIVPPPIPWHERPPAVHDSPPAKAVFESGQTTDSNGSVSYPLLCLEYFEQATELVPVLYSEQACDPQRREHSRVDEGYRFVWRWVRLSELPAYHWKTRQGGCADVIDDCHGGGEKGGCCLDLHCPPHHSVPLALIRVATDGPVTNQDIDMLGRPSLEPPEHVLTHICGINWPHGGEVTRDYVEKHLRKLRIQFDRHLKPASDHSGMCGPDGVNGCTFVVQFGGGYEDLDFVTPHEPPHLEHDSVAVFNMGGRAEKHRHPYAYLENQTVYITLKCDFILDCHGRAVDGNHIGGVLPTGDGVRGGTFESWFHVIPDSGDTKPATKEADRGQSS